MSDSEQNNSIFSNIDLLDVSTSWTHKLNKESLINELNRTNLKTVGFVIELRNRLIKYLRGESTHDNFQLAIEKNFMHTGSSFTY